MKKFLKYVAIFSASLIILAVGTEYMLRQVPNSLAFKRNLLETHKQEVKSLIIGSSVANCGINPAYLSDSTYNLAVSGEWFRFNQQLVEKYINDLPNLQNLFWGICFHSLWMDDDAGFDISSIVNHKIYMGISDDKNPLYNCELLSLGALSMRKWSKHYIRRKPTMRCDSLGVDHSYDLEFRERDWLEEIPSMAYNQRKSMLADEGQRLYRENVNRIHRVAALCHERGVALFLVMPPVYPDYFRLLDKDQLAMVHAAIKEVEERWDNVHCFEYLGDTRFAGDDFYDGNHLSSDIGTVKFTKILKHDIEVFVNAVNGDSMDIKVTKQYEP